MSTIHNMPPGVTDETISDPDPIEPMSWEDFADAYPDAADRIYQKRFLEVREAIDQIAADKMEWQWTRKTLLKLYDMLEADAAEYLATAIGAGKGTVAA